MVRVLATDSWDYYNSWQHYYIGETEVTQELWKAVMGSSNNPSYFKGDNLPVENISYDNCLTFIEKLNSKTGLTFKVPTYEQWYYAFKGACISKGYEFSGSNNVDDVAWSQGNPDSQTHDVKTKQPNEIGIYDMSGNVSEATEGIGGCYGGNSGRSNWYSNHFNGNDFELTIYDMPDNYTGLRLCLDI